MSLERTFLGWHQPLVDLAAAWLFEHARSDADDSHVDLSTTTLIVPGQRVGTRLRERLMFASYEQGQGLVQPRILTPGAFVEAVCRGGRATPPHFYRGVLAGQAAHKLVANDSAALEGLLHRPPSSDDLRGWTRFGTTVIDLRDDLVGAACDVDPSTWPQAAQALIAQGQEAQRWEIIQHIIQVYDEQLADMGSDDPARQRLNTLANHSIELDDGHDLILVGVNDPTPLLRRVIGIAAQQAEVRSLVWAPEGTSQGFDELGGVEPDYWSNRPIEIDDGSLWHAESASAVDQHLFEILNGWNGAFAGGDITIGVAERGYLEPIRNALAAVGTPVRYAGGRPLGQSPEAQALQLTAAYLRDRSYESFSNLIRHCDVADALAVDAEVLAAADEYHRDHLPLSTPTGSSWLEPDEVSEPESRRTRLKEVEQRLSELLGALAEPAIGMIDVHMEAVRIYLKHLYGERQFDQADPVQRASLSQMRSLNESIDLLGHAPSEVQEALGERTVAEHLETLLSAIEPIRTAEPPNPAAIELTDWLELAHDDAPAIVLVGFNEGCVPRTEAAHPFLPDTLRGALGLEHNQARAARDAHGLTAMMAGRQSQGRVELMVLKRTSRHDPLAPSRLLFQVSDPKVAAQRVLRLTDDRTSEGEMTQTIHPALAGPPGDGLALIRPDAIPTCNESVSVTAFKQYLACPYRYWLRRVQRLEHLDDADQEIDAAGFGSLIHHVLQEYGEDQQLRDLEDPEAIEEAFSTMLNARVDALFGGNALSSVDLQVEQARQRLRVFAEHQAQRRQAGWRIIQAEFTVGRRQPVLVTCGDDQFAIHGRIDRIDLQESTGRLGVYDYKTSSLLPAAAHQKGRVGSKEWVDLQLPLYRHLVRRLDVDHQDVELGYALLPADPQMSGFQKANWDDRELKDADQTALRIAQSISAGQFWPPAEIVPAFSEDLAAICQDHALNAEVVGGGA